VVLALFQTQDRGSVMGPAKRMSIIFHLLLFFGLAALAEQAPRPEWWQPDLLPANREEINTNGLKAAFYTPARGSGPWKPVVWLSGSQGGMVRGARLNRLIMSGYCVITPEYLSYGKEFISVPLEFFDQTLDWLKNDSRVAPGGVAVVGGSKGGELALLLASRNKEIKAVVGLVPSSHVFKGIAKRPHSGSSWSYDGKDLPFLPYSNLQAMMAAMTDKKFRKTYESGWNKRANYPASRIPVENSNAAVLLLSGKDDAMWPSTPMCTEIMARLNAAHYEHPYEHVAYDCGHAVGGAREHGIKITEFLRAHYAPQPKLIKED